MTSAPSAPLSAPRKRLLVSKGADGADVFFLTVLRVNSCLFRKTGLLRLVFMFAYDSSQDSRSYITPDSDVLYCEFNVPQIKRQKRLFIYLV